MLAWLERYRWWVVALLAVPLLVGIGFLLNERLSGPEPLEIRSDGGPPGAGSAIPGYVARAVGRAGGFPPRGGPPGAGSAIAVYVAGAVARPGVYTLREGDRLVDALEAAGGPSAEADLL